MDDRGRPILSGPASRDTSLGRTGPALAARAEPDRRLLDAVAAAFTAYEVPRLAAFAGGGNRTHCPPQRLTLSDLNRRPSLSGRSQQERSGRGKAASPRTPRRP